MSQGESPEAGKPQPSLLEQAQQLVSGPHASELLAQRLASHWEWATQLGAAKPDNTLQTSIRSARSAVEKKVVAAQEAAAKAESTINWMQTPSERTQGLSSYNALLFARRIDVVSFAGWKAKALEFRRKYPAPLVAAITAVAIAPPVLQKVHAPSTLLCTMLHGLEMPVSIGQANVSRCLYPRIPQSINANRCDIINDDGNNLPTPLWTRFSHRHH